jgi:diacylglycerol kinase (ATP)
MSGNRGPVAVLTNPAAGRGRHHGLVPAIVERLAGAGRTVSVLEPATAVEAEAACQAAITAGAGALVVIGGDGTLHAALQAAAGSGVPFGAVPAGTGNDLAGALGLPAEPLAAADAIAAALRAGRTRSVDLGLVGDSRGRQRWFGAVLGAGFDAIVNERANRMRWPRGARKYDTAIFLELLRLRSRRYVMHLDGVEHRFDGILVAVANTASYGGGMRICPDAVPTDGLLDVVVGGRFSRTALARIKPRLYRGTHVTHRLVHTYRARQVRLAADCDVTTYADGERCLPLPVTITCVASALRVLTP